MPSGDLDVRTILMPLAVATAVSFALTACGGGGQPGVVPGAPSISGTVAIGRPLAGATVRLNCIGGGAVATTAPDGSFSVDIPSGVITPCVISVTGTVNGQQIVLHSIAPNPGTVNVTPLTELLTTMLAQQAGMGSVDQLAQQIGTSSSAQQLLSNPRIITNAEKAVLSLVAANGAAASNSQDFLTTPFTANHTGADADLDALQSAGVVDASGVPSSNVQSGAVSMGKQLATNDGVTPNSAATISGSLSGLQTGTTIALVNNGGDPLGLSANGTFSLLAPVAVGNQYAVTVGTQPFWQSCNVTGGSGTASASTSPITVQCEMDNAQVSTIARTADAPYGVAFDPTSGNLYVADYAGNAILKIGSDGTAHPFVTLTSHPLGITFDKKGNIYSLNWSDAAYAGSVSMITPDGHTVTTIATLDSNTSDGIGVDSKGNVYVDNLTSVYKLDATNNYQPTLFAGSDTTMGFKDGAGKAALFDNVFDLTVGPDDSVYVADVGNYVIRKITPDGTVSTVAGQPGQPGYRDGAASQSLLGGMLQPDGNFVPVTYDANGVTTQYGDANYHLAVNAAGVWISDAANNVIRRIDASGNITTVAGTQVYARRTAPTSGWVIANMQMIDGVGTAANFTEPWALATDPKTGDLYVADFRGNAIRKITPTPPSQ